MLKIYQDLDETLKNKEIIKVNVLDIKTEIKDVSPPIPMDTQLAQSSINSMF